MAVLTAGAVQDLVGKSLGVESIHHHQVYRWPYQTLPILITAEILFAIPLKRLRANAKPNPRPFLAFSLVQAWTMKGFWGEVGWCCPAVRWDVRLPSASPPAANAEKGGTQPWWGCEGSRGSPGCLLHSFPMPQIPGSCQINFAPR